MNRSVCSPGQSLTNILADIKRLKVRVDGIFSCVLHLTHHGSSLQLVIELLSLHELFVFFLESEGQLLVFPAKSLLIQIQTLGFGQ